MKKYALCLISFIFLASIILAFYLNPKHLSVTIKGKEKKTSYFVEVADTSEKALKGLMDRKSMPSDQGMLFVFPYPKIVQMWMKNTYIPLDMVFFNAQNQVICLHENAQPLDESIITCSYPVQKVLEINAGQVKAQNIRLGDTLLVK